MQPVEQKIDHWRRVECQHLRHQQPADNGDAERTPQFRARAAGDHQRNGAQHGGERGHQNRPEAFEAGFVNCAMRRDRPSLRSPSSAKSTIMIPFFFTMPISRMMPMKAITDSSVPEISQREQSAEACRGQCRNDRQGVCKALVQHAKHDVDRNQCRQQQQWLCTDGPLERLYVAGEVGMDSVGYVHFGDRLLKRSGGVLDRDVFGARL